MFTNVTDVAVAANTGIPLEIINLFKTYGENKKKKKFLHEGVVVIIVVVVVFVVIVVVGALKNKKMRQLYDIEIFLTSILE